jgi:hypothetical protein
MSGWLGKFANFLIKVERFAASIRDPTPPGQASFGRLGDEVEVTCPCSKAGE